MIDEKAFVEVVSDVSACKADVVNLKQWQVSQNGSLRRIENKVDVLHDTTNTQFATLIQQMNSYQRKQDARIIALLATVTSACILIVIDLVIRIGSRCAITSTLQKVVGG
jgi:hypothetical protein